MFRPVFKALTINRLPRELVDLIKLLAIENDCTIPEVCEVLLLAGIETTKDSIYADIHGLRLRKKKERAERAKVKEELAQLQLKMDKETVGNDSSAE